MLSEAARATNAHRIIVTAAIACSAGVDRSRLRETVRHVDEPLSGCRHRKNESIVICALGIDDGFRKVVDVVGAIEVDL